MKQFSFLNNYWIVGFAALCGLSIFALKVLSSHGWDAMAFVLERPADIPAEQKWGVGYDGQQSYAIAVNTWGSTEGLDQPGYRYQRILYPLLVRFFSLGRVEAVPWVMLVLNLISTGFGCAGFGRLLQRRGTSPWLALVFSFSLGYLLSVRMDLLEPLALALAFWGWIAWEEERPVSGILLFALSGLTKEVGLVFAAGLAFWELLQKHMVRSASLFFGSVLPYGIWYLILQYWFGTSPEQISQSKLLLPFTGLRYLDDLPSLVLVSAWVLIPSIITSLAAAWELLKHLGKDVRLDAVMLLAQATLVAVMPAPTWVDPLAILRIGLGLVAVTLVWLAGAHRRLLPLASGLWASSGLVVFFVPNLL